MRNRLTRRARNDNRGASKVAADILELIGQVPKSDEHEARDPAKRAHIIARKAAIKALITAGTLSLPPGPLGWLTIIPELVGVWKMQAHMVADIAGVYGKTASLTSEQMLYCLFKHLSSQAVRDLVVRVGERVLIRRASSRAIQSVANQLGIHVTQRVVGRSIGRWIPVVGALGVGAYAYYDTRNVARTAIELFESEIELG